MPPKDLRPHPRKRQDEAASYLPARLENLFQAMASGGDFGADEILWFNGGLFADAEVIALGPRKSRCWSRVNALRLGQRRAVDLRHAVRADPRPGQTLADRRHYTSRADIVTLLEPVLMAPLRREWAEVKRRCEEVSPLLGRGAGGKGAATHGVGATENRPSTPDLRAAVLDFVERLHHVTVLDPACGSGNFLYVAINLLLDLEKEVIAYAASARR